ncbi:MAG: hypothetical protein ACOX0F_01840 [Syntrophomonadaceae bacterium]|jgi:hypothetical protein
MIFTAIEKIKEQVIGIVPSYEARGDVTMVLTDQGDALWERRSLNAVRRALARCYLLDLREQNRQVRGLFKRRKILPFYLSPERVFIPVKVRRARIKNDCCYGYIDWRYIEAQADHDQAGTVITISNGLKLQSLGSLSNLVQNLHRGRHLYELLQHNKGRNPSGEQLLLEAARLLAGSLDLIHTGLGKLGKNG